MKTLGNILWHFPFLGFVSAFFAYLIGLLLTATVIAAPIGLGLMEFGKFLLSPFGNAMVSKSELNVQQNKAWKAYSTVVLVLYLPFGLFFAFCAVIQVFFLCLSIAGIPVALVIAKSLGTYLNPVNKKCVPSAVRDELERRKGQVEVEKYLGRDGRETVTNSPRLSKASASAASQVNTAQEQSALATNKQSLETSIPSTAGISLSAASVGDVSRRGGAEALAIKFCINCGSALDAGVAFCGQCGAVTKIAQDFEVEKSNANPGLPSGNLAGRPEFLQGNDPVKPNWLIVAAVGSLIFVLAGGFAFKKWGHTGSPQSAPSALESRWLGKWKALDGKRTMEISSRRIIVVSDEFKRGPEDKSTRLDIKWSSNLEEGFGYTGKMASPGDYLRRYELALAAQKKDPTDFYVTPTIDVARKWAAWLAPIQYHELSSYGVGDAPASKWIADEYGNLLEISEGHYGVHLLLLQRISQ